MKKSIDLCQFLDPDGQFVGFAHYGVKATPDPDNSEVTTYERILDGNDEPDCYGLYLIVRVKKGIELERWLGDFKEEKELVDFKEVLNTLVKIARAGHIGELHSFAGWTQLNILERATCNELELSEDEATEVLTWLNDHCEAGQGIGNVEIDKAINDYLRNKYSLPLIWGYHFHTILSARSLHYFDRMVIIPRNHAVSMRMQNHNVWIVDTISGDAQLMEKLKYPDETLQMLSEQLEPNHLITVNKPILGKVIGYQIVSKDDREEYPAGIDSRNVYTAELADRIRIKFNMPTEWLIVPVYEADELGGEPIFIGSAIG